MDWEKLGDEAVDLLSEYIRIDTSNPPGNEASGADFLADVLRSEGIECKLYESAPGRSSLLARLEGGGRGKPMVLMNHIDVVPAEAGKWDVDPFSGEVSDGYVWGRGALDMKGMGIMELMALVVAKREGLDLDRDLVFLACADEETGGDLGCKYLLDNHPGELEADLVINEGGFANTTLIGGLSLFMVASAEKYAIWLRLSTRGEGGHGSMPSGRGALDRLVVALAKLAGSQQPMRIGAAARDFLGTLADHWAILEPYKEDGDVGTLEKLLVENNLTAIPALNAMVRNTVSLNMLKAGVKVNVIPDEAEAYLDCRLLPETVLEEFIESLGRTLDDPEIDVEVVMGGEASPDSPAGGGFYDVLQKTIEENYTDAVVTPFLLPGMSDSRFFRRLGVPVYGIISARLDLEDLSRVHGVNERLSIEDLKEGVRFMYALASACAGRSG